MRLADVFLDALSLWREKSHIGEGISYLNASVINICAKKDIGVPRAGSKLFRDSLKTQEPSLIWVFLFNQWCKIG